MMSSGRGPRIIEEGHFGIKPGAKFAEFTFHALWSIEKKHRVSHGHALLSDHLHPQIASLRRWSVPPIAPWP
jgi:hypothetical protein